VLDTAGLRQGGDAVEEEGVRRARSEISRADRVLFVIDAAADPAASAWREERAQLPAGVAVTLVFNKCDLVTAQGAKVTPLDPGNEADVRKIAAGDFSSELGH
jgi:tRNA modification GTPase